MVVGNGPTPHALPNDATIIASAGGKTKASAILHGFIIMISLILIPGLLNMIPLATLAAILFVVGFKLAIQLLEDAINDRL